MRNGSVGSIPNLTVLRQTNGCVAERSFLVSGERHEGATSLDGTALDVVERSYPT